MENSGIRVLNAKKTILMNINVLFIDYFSLKYSFSLDTIWFGLLNGISTTYGLFNTEIWLLCKCLIAFDCNFFFFFWIALFLIV